MNDRDKNKGTIMILTSGKVVGNIREHWQEVRDNRVKNKDGARQEVNQSNNGKKLVPVENVVVEQVQTYISLQLWIVLMPGKCRITSWQ